MCSCFDLFICATPHHCFLSCKFQLIQPPQPPNPQTADLLVRSLLCLGSNSLCQNSGSDSHRKQVWKWKSPLMSFLSSITVSCCPVPGKQVLHICFLLLGCLRETDVSSTYHSVKAPSKSLSSFNASSFSLTSSNCPISNNLNTMHFFLLLVKILYFITMIPQTTLKNSLPLMTFHHIKYLAWFYFILSSQMILSINGITFTDYF